MKPTVSIIIPVYNAEQTVQRCVDSVLRQEYTDFELILVDDGSIDSSGAILDRYAQRDRRVRVIHKKNTGVSDSRNMAIAQAEGTYLQFLDSDDWITPDATKLLVRAVREHPCDLVISDFYRVVGERVSQKGDIDDTAVLSREEFAAHMMENPADYYYGVLWNKLYRRRIISAHKLRMDRDISWCEDFMFNLEYIRYAKSFYALQVPIYYYVKRKGSLANQNISISKTVRMKLTVFEYYNQFYKTVLDESEYEKSRLKVYKFLFDAAQDGVVPPSILPGSKRLGNERVAVRVPGGGGILQKSLRDRKRLEYYLESAALKNDLTLADALVLLCLSPEGSVTASRRELAELTGLSRGALSVSLQKLNSKELLRIEECRDRTGGARRLRLTLLPVAASVAEDLAVAQEDWSQARLAGLSPEERSQYAGLVAKMECAGENGG